MFRILRSQKNKQMVAWDGYLYTFKRQTAKFIHWRCSDRNCNGTLKTPMDLNNPEADCFFTVMTPHRHQPRPDLVFRAEARNNVVAQAMNTDNSPRNILHGELQTQPQSNVSVVGSLNGVQQLINRRRRMSVPVNDINEELLNIDNELMVTVRGHQFYQFGPSRMRGIRVESSLCMFFAENMIGVLRDNGVWSIDGTFSVCPAPFKQLYTISVLKNHHVIPVVFCLLKTKSESEYDRMISILNSLVPNLVPRKIVADFELAAINSFKRNFSSVFMSSCLFHLGQNVQRHLTQSGLGRAYSSNDILRKFVKSLMCLSFVRVDSVRETFLFLNNHQSFPESLSELFRYFYNNYIGSEDGVVRATYPIEMWNSISNLFDDVARTNNAIEGWHNQFRGSFGPLNKTPRIFVKKLIQEQENIEIKWGRLMDGETLPFKSKYKRISLGLKNFIEEKIRNNEDPKDYIFELTEYVYY